MKNSKIADNKTKFLHKNYSVSNKLSNFASEIKTVTILYMDWLINLFTVNDSVAHIALLYALVIATGVYLGKIKFGGVALGVTFVLFAGIVAGHLGLTAPINILTFIQDFGLILFVFMIGQIGRAHV